MNNSYIWGSLGQLEHLMVGPGLDDSAVPPIGRLALVMIETLKVERHVAARDLTGAALEHGPIVTVLAGLEVAPAAAGFLRRGRLPEQFSLGPRH